MLQFPSCPNELCTCYHQSKWPLFCSFVEKESIIYLMTMPLSNACQFLCGVANWWGRDRGGQCWFFPFLFPLWTQHHREICSWVALIIWSGLGLNSNDNNIWLTNLVQILFPNNPLSHVDQWEILSFSNFQSGKYMCIYIYSMDTPTSFYIYYTHFYL